MLYSIEQLKNFSANMVQELEMASNGGKTNFAYARNTIIQAHLVADGELFQAMIMGGTHLESALVRKTANGLEILNFYNDFLPTLATKEVVCATFIKHLHPEVKVLSLNFAYPIQPIERENRLDGVLISGTKEHRFDGMVNTTVGLELEKYVLEKLNRKIKISVCNDTVSLGLAAANNYPNQPTTHIIAGVVGTGFNFGFFEEENVFINTESGNFANFEQSYTAKIIDCLSTNPGKQFLEKEVGGAYLCKHFNLESRLNGQNIYLHTTKELSQLASDSSLGHEIALEVIQRAASLVAMEIYSLYQIIQKKNPVLNQEKSVPVICIIEGSLFWQGYNFRQWVQEYLEKFGVNADQLQIVKVDKSGVLGAARLAI